MLMAKSSEQRLPKRCEKWWGDTNNAMNQMANWRRNANKSKEPAKQQIFSGNMKEIIKCKWTDDEQRAAASQRQFDDFAITTNRMRAINPNCTVYYLIEIDDTKISDKGHRADHQQRQRQPPSACIKLYVDGRQLSISSYRHTEIARSGALQDHSIVIYWHWKLAILFIFKILFACHHPESTDLFRR